MEGLTVTAFSFSIMGMAALVLVIRLTTRVEKLMETLKENGILDQGYKGE
jgi:hypothetical protein